MKKPEKIAVLIVAGGKGNRLGGGIPKQYRYIGDKSVLSHNILKFLNNPNIGLVMVVIGKGHEKLYAAATKNIKNKKLLPPVTGGKMRQDSVLNGLIALEKNRPDKILIHDAARPFASDELINKLIESLDKNLAVIPATPVSDTLKAVKGSKIIKTIDKADLKAVQTPQCFRFETIFSCHKKMKGGNFTDDAAVAEACGIEVAFVEAEDTNFKITYETDLERAKNMLGVNMEYRTGSGFDVHAFEKKKGGNSLIICGVKIPHEKSLSGHSDADVGLHALVDALLGAVGEGDIGLHFPPSDKRWKGADSALFVRHAAKLLAKKQAKISNIDITIICEAPKISFLRERMRKNIAGLLGIEISRVSVKATTTEELGFTGRKEGIAAQAIATVMIKG